MDIHLKKSLLKLAVGLWFLLLAAPGIGLPSESHAASDRQEQLLSDALSELQTQGLPVFYTSNVVRPEMRVLKAPTSQKPVARLRELLAPHGLTTEAGPGGRLVVIEAGPAGIRGVVRDQRSGKPLGNVQMMVPGTPHGTLTDDRGSFLLSKLPPGRHSLEAHLPGYVIQRVEDVTVRPGTVTEVGFTLEATLLALDEIIVTPSLMSLLREEPVTGLDLDRKDIFSLPHLGDDIFRALTLLPGVSGEEVSARFNVRGGRSDEVLVLLDQVELYEPYHLKDFSSSLSIIAPKTLREVNLITGGFPAEYGDRMSGVLDMTTRQAERRKTHIGLGTLTAEVGSSGTYAGDRAHWLTTLRRGNLDLTVDFLGEKQEPSYWDGFGKVDFQPRPGQTIGFNVLHSDDSLNFSNIDPDVTEDYFTSYGNSYGWLTHQAILGTSLFVDSTLSIGHVDRNRQGKESELEPGNEGLGFNLIDQRSLDVFGLKQNWNLQASEHHYLKWGFEARELVSDYDYLNTRALEDPLAEYRSEPRTGITRFVQRLSGEHYSAYLSDRWRPFDALTMEFGLRYDEQTITADRHLSPRINLVYALGQSSLLRAAWGHFYQSQRPYELQVEDGITTLASAERNEQRVIGFERTFATGAEESDLLLRIEAYQRLVENPRRRYENIFEPVSQFPEIELDRVLFTPESARAYGLEVFLRGNQKRLDWWASYTWSRTEDRIDGRNVPRRIDQPHALNLDVNFSPGKHWNVNLAWRIHSGWPTTAVSGRIIEDEDGEDEGEDSDSSGEPEDGEAGDDDIELAPVLGPFNAERLPVYHRLDLRASREWRKKKGVLGFFIEIQNVYDRKNAAGFDEDFDLELSPNGEVLVEIIEEPWGGILPSFGITWEF